MKRIPAAGNKVKWSNPSQHSGGRRSEAGAYKQDSKIRDYKVGDGYGPPANGHRVSLRLGNPYD